MYNVNRFHGHDKSPSNTHNTLIQLLGDENVSHALAGNFGHPLQTAVFLMAQHNSNYSYFYF